MRSYGSCNSVLLLTLTLICICSRSAGQSRQEPTYVFGNEPLTLDRGWTYHDGINDAWLSANFDDRDWKAINPTQDFKKLGFFNYNKPITLRLKFQIDQLPTDSIFLCIRQSVASRVYLNGNLIANYG